MRTWHTTTSSAADTRRLGKLFGSHLKVGSVLLLNGSLSAGKTCFAQGVGAGLELSSKLSVTSPSYTLLNVYYGRLPLYHFDLYRLSRVDDLTDLGYDEYAEGEGVTLVEWSDRMSVPLRSSLEVQISRIDDQSREFDFFARDQSGAELLERVADEWSKTESSPSTENENL